MSLANSKEMVQVKISSHFRKSWNLFLFSTGYQEKLGYWSISITYDSGIQEDSYALPHPASDQRGNVKLASSWVQHIE